MNTPKQLLSESPGNFAVHENLISREQRKMLERTPAVGARRNHQRLAILIFGGIALVAYSLRQALAGLPHQEFEGLGVVACFLTYVAIFLWQVGRAMTQESREAVRLNDTAILPRQEKQPTVQPQSRTE
jgi:Na+-transporting methylmalonyl-CoA/oxaloacetate decarboxylase gamma subunit